MIELLAVAFRDCKVDVSGTIRVAALSIKLGVTSNGGKGDDWPALRMKILTHEILILGSPIWLGQVGSVAKRVRERMDAFLSETDEQGRMRGHG